MAEEISVENECEVRVNCLGCALAGWSSCLLSNHCEPDFGGECIAPLCSRLLLQIGDEMFGLAGYIAVKHTRVPAKPKELGQEEVAGEPETWIMASEIIFCSINRMKSWSVICQREQSTILVSLVDHFSSCSSGSEE